MAVNWWRLKYKWIEWLTDLGCHWWLSSNFPHPSSSRENVPLISSCSAWWSKEKTSMSQRTDGSQYIIHKHSWRSTLWLVLATLWFFIGSLLAYLPTSGCENEEIFWNIGSPFDPTSQIYWMNTRIQKEIGLFTLTAKHILKTKQKEQPNAIKSQDLQLASQKKLFKFKHTDKSVCVCMCVLKSHYCQTDLPKWEEEAKKSGPQSSEFKQVT